MKKEKDFWIANENAKEALKELMSLIIMNSRKVKWMKDNVFITVSKNRTIEAWHNPDESK